MRRNVADRADDARGTERDDAIARAGAQSEGRPGVVAGARPENRARRGLARRLRRTQHGGKIGPPAPHRQFEQVELIAAGLRREVAGSAGIAAVGAQIGDVVEPLSRQVSQSCGRHTAAVASACAGS